MSATHESASHPKGGTTPIDKFHETARLTGIIGIAFSVLFLASVLVFAQMPHKGASDAEVIDYYEAGSHQLIRLGGLYILPLAAIAFLWFIASLNSWVEFSGRPIDRLMSTVQLLGGVSFVTLALAASAAATVASFSNDQYVITPDLARQFPLFGRTLLVVFGMRMAALFVMSTAKLGHGSGLLPRWFTAVSVAVALVLFASSSLNVLLTLIFPLWVSLLCGLIWVRRSLHPAHPRQSHPA